MTTKQLALRQLQKDDAPALLTFYNGLSTTTIHNFRPLREKTTLAVCQAIVQANTAMPAPRFDLVAWHGEQMVGWAFLEQLTSAEPQLGLGVTDAWQGQGVGRALLNGLLVQARQYPLPTIYLIVVHDNQRAIHLYQSCGFVAYDQHFDDEDQLTYLSMRKEIA
ncbi:MAG: GNAT family N-acetyltransferase [Caldilinea sp. CFX5]|nr:GNAT family N-acetyltransferase [Caldilinea sp. CFX5]